MIQAAVLTGDLIGSTEAGPEVVDRVMEELEVAAEELFLKDIELTGIEPLRFTRSRGDGWQAIVMPAGHFLRVTTYLLAKLRQADLGLQTRIGIGIGTVQTMGTDSLADAYGSAFILSGRALDQIGQQDLLAINADTGIDIRWPSAAIEMLAYLSGRWSVEQAGAMASRLLAEMMPLHKIAEKHEISRQALSSRLAVAGERPLMAAIRAAEATL